MRLIIIKLLIMAFLVVPVASACAKESAFLACLLEADSEFASNFVSPLTCTFLSSPGCQETKNP